MTPISVPTTTRRSPTPGPETVNVTPLGSDTTSVTRMSAAGRSP